MGLKHWLMNALGIEPFNDPGFFIPKEYRILRFPDAALPLVLKKIPILFSSLTGLGVSIELAEENSIWKEKLGPKTTAPAFVPPRETLGGTFLLHFTFSDGVLEAIAELLDKEGYKGPVFHLWVYRDKEYLLYGHDVNCGEFTLTKEVPYECVQRFCEPTGATEYFAPSDGAERGWEVYFGSTGNRNRFLIEMMNAVPDGSHLEVADHNIPQVPELQEFVRRSEPGGWFQKAMCVWTLNERSRVVLSRSILALDLRKSWIDIKIHGNGRLFLDAHDFLEDSTTFVTESAGIAVLERAKGNGIIERFEYFVPSRAADEVERSMR